LSTKGGTRGEVRTSALWGTGSRGGESRSSALWGKGGRGFVTLFAAIFLLGVPLVAGADNGSKKASAGGAYVSPRLLKLAAAHPGSKLDVIVSSDNGVSGAEGAAKNAGGSLRRRLGVVDGVAVQMPAARVAQLEKVPGLSVTLDAPVKLDALPYSTQLWPYASGIAPLWWSPLSSSYTPTTIAVVDSGIQADRPDFAGRVLANVNLTTLPNNSPGDGRGHGTFVSGIAAGAAAGYAGGAPNAKLVSLDVMDDSGMARTSDVIAAAQWILANKDTYGIRVANFSLHSTAPSNFYRDPLDQAVERLWFSGVVVVAAAGNYGTTSGPSGVPYAPGNDPFVITVGATDVNGTIWTNDDTIAPWSAYGYTDDGFWKPDISAPGRYVVGPVPPTSTLVAERPDSVTAPGYMKLSGTSFSAPVISGVAAQLLARHPDWSPDQVKGALMETARSLPLVGNYAGGVGEVNAAAAAFAPPFNPNRALERFVSADSSGGQSFDAVSWLDAAKNDVSWDSVAWNDVSWTDVSWESVAWSDVSLSDVSWEDVAWSDNAQEDAANTDTAGSPYQLSPDQVQAAEQGTTP
jgi:serine protease AprX